jgi:two-component system, OmpR family, KDP operon response regulator KdpE
VSSDRPVVLVVEDEPQIRRFLRTSLGAHGFDVLEAENGSRGLADAAARRPDCLILDLGLPDMEGVDVIRRLREWTALPVIVLSARAQESDKVAALDAGADDYVTKPFGVSELLARLRVALRHSAALGSGSQSTVFQAGDVRVDLEARRVTLSGTEVHLTPTEYRLLATLVRHAGRVLTQRFLLKEVWGPAYIERPHYLRIYMANLRQKLERDPARPALLLTETGVGYRLAES